jgi:hypothetical protein
MKKLRDIVEAKLESALQNHEATEKSVHHDALEKLGLFHLGSARKTYGDKDWHEHLFQQPEQKSRWHEGFNPNERRKTINSVVKYLKAQGYNHWTTKGNLGVHYFEKRQPGETDQFKQAKNRLEMHTRNLWPISIKHYNHKV